MADKSPFAGMRLSEQRNSPPTPLDQQLFSARPNPPNAQAKLAAVREAPGAAKEPSKIETLESSKLASKEGSLEPRNQGNLDRGATRTRRWELDLDEPAYRKNTYAFTEQELNALEDIAIDIRRNLGLDVTKNELVRCAIHALAEDFSENSDRGDTVRRLRKKQRR